MPLSVFGGRDENARFASQVEDSHKKGTSSPAGFFALLGDLDYYALIEMLVKGPVTDKQLVTPFRFWLFLKGSAFASLLSILLLFVRSLLLMSSPDVDFDVKFVLFLVISSAVVYATAVKFISYIRYPGGVTWTAVKYTLSGYISGLISAEFLKEVVFGVTHYYRQTLETFVATKPYFFRAFVNLYYESFLGPIYGEVFFLLCIFAMLIAAQKYFNVRTEYFETMKDLGKPYDLAN